MENLDTLKNRNPTTSSFGVLNAQLEKLVHQIGCPMTLELINNLIANREIDHSDPTKLQRLKEFLMDRSTLEYDLQGKEFFTSRMQEYHDARMACQYLTRKHTKCSHAMVGELWQTSKRMAIYACNKYDEMLSIPDYYQEELTKLNQLEIALLKFLTHLK